MYNGLKNHQLIMVGEMHGTQEPAKLVDGLANTILQYEPSVSVGLEIPEDELLSYFKSRTDSSLRSSTFFSKENKYGMNGQAWFNLIRSCSANLNINLFFFDNFKSYQISNRDSAMYLSIIKQLELYPESKIITLSGNVHNRLTAYKGSSTLGSYCRNDTINFTTSQICSINHLFSEGTMLNNTGNGLDLQTIEFQESVYSKAVDFTIYILFTEPNSKNPYNVIFYSRKVHTSDVVGSDTSSRPRIKYRAGY